MKWQSMKRQTLLLVSSWYTQTARATTINSTTYKFSRKELNTISGLDMDELDLMGSLAISVCILLTTLRRTISNQ